MRKTKTDYSEDVLRLTFVGREAVLMCVFRSTLKAALYMSTEKYYEYKVDIKVDRKVLVQS
jgi:hypothetical protein